MSQCEKAGPPLEGFPPAVAFGEEEQTFCTLLTLLATLKQIVPTSVFSGLTNEVVHTCSTIGSNVEEIVLRKTHFLMWDLGGQEALRSTWDTYYSNAEFVILVIDSTDRNRLLTTREELYKMLAHEALQNASVLIFANKQDVKDSMTTAEISQFLTLSAIKDHPWHIQGCCALTGEGLPAGLQWMQAQATAN